MQNPETLSPEIFLAETERLLLRRIDPEVHDHVFKEYADDALMQFFGFTTSAELEKERNRFLWGTRMFNKTFLYFQLIDKATKRVIGNCGFHTVYTDHARGEIFYLLFDDVFKQKGIVSEAMKYVLSYGFSEMKLNRVEAYIGAENIASLAVAAKFNFQKEGVLRGHYYTNNRFEDSMVFGLLKENYLR